MTKIIIVRRKSLFVSRATRIKSHNSLLYLYFQCGGQIKICYAGANRSWHSYYISAPCTNGVYRQNNKCHYAQISGPYM